jgi:uncharacterized membrane protein
VDCNAVQLGETAVSELHGVTVQKASFFTVCSSLKSSRLMIQVSLAFPFTVTNFDTFQIQQPLKNILQVLIFFPLEL